MNLKKLNNDELTDYRLTITVDKGFYFLVEGLLDFINSENGLLSSFQSGQIKDAFRVEKGGIYKSTYYRELNNNEYNVSLGEPKSVDK